MGWGPFGCGGDWTGECGEESLGGSCGVVPGFGSGGGGSELLVVGTGGFGPVGGMVFGFGGGLLLSVSVCAALRARARCHWAAARHLGQTVRAQVSQAQHRVDLP